MLIKVTPENVMGRLIAQNMKTYECIIETEETPLFDYEEVDDIPQGFMQLMYPGTFGEYLDIATIRMIEVLKEGLSEQEFAETSTIKELKMRNEISCLTTDVDQLALKFLEKEGVV